MFDDLLSVRHETQTSGEPKMVRPKRPAARELLLNLARPERGPRERPAGLPGRSRHLSGTYLNIGRSCVAAPQALRSCLLERSSSFSTSAIVKASEREMLSSSCHATGAATGIPLRARAE